LIRKIMVGAAFDWSGEGGPPRVSSRAKRGIWPRRENRVVYFFFRGSRSHYSRYGGNIGDRGLGGFWADLTLLIPSALLDSVCSPSCLVWVKIRSNQPKIRPIRGQNLLTLYPANRLDFSETISSFWQFSVS